MSTVLSRSRLAVLLGASIGQEKASEVIGTAARSLGYFGDEFDQDQTLGILDVLARSGGLVGTVARFAKARVILLFEE